MTSRVQFALRVPVADVEAYEKRIDEKYAQKNPYAGTELEREVRAFLEMDGLARIESLVDGLLRAAGRRPTDVSEKKRPEERAPSDGGTKPVNYRIDEDVRDEFISYVSEHSSTSAGRVLGLIMRSYARGGIVERIHDRLSRVVDDAKRLLSGLTDGQDDGRLGKVEANVITISKRLTEDTETFRDEELVEAIHDVVGSGPRAADKTVEKYRRLVTERLGVEPDPYVEQNPKPVRVWTPSERARDAAEDGTPRECRLPVDLLDADDLTRRVKIESGLRASERQHGSARVTLTDVHRGVLGEDVSKQQAKGALEAAALEEGYELETDAQQCSLTVDLSTVAAENRDLYDTIIAYRDGEKQESPADEPAASDTTEDSPPDNVGDEWNRLEAATDGGWSVEGNS